MPADAYRDPSRRRTVSNAREWRKGLGKSFLSRVL